MRSSNHLTLAAACLVLPALTPFPATGQTPCPESCVDTGYHPTCSVSPDFDISRTNACSNGRARYDLRAGTLGIEAWIGLCSSYVAVDAADEFQIAGLAL